MSTTPTGWPDPRYDPEKHGMIFKPGPDITAYELARIVGMVSPLTKILSPVQVAKWSRELQRHWKPIK